MNCSWLVRTDPKDVARVESRTVISTSHREDVIPSGRAPHEGALPNWIHTKQLDKEIMTRFPNTMKGNYHVTHITFHATANEAITFLYNSM